MSEIKIGVFDYIEYDQSGKNLFILDVHIEKKNRNKGKASEKLSELLYRFPGKVGWIASVSKPMDRVCEKLGFVKIGGKGGKRKNIPQKVNHQNANVWKKEL